MFPRERGGVRRIFDEGRAFAAAMLFKSYLQAISDADVQRTVSAAGQGVNIIGACVAHACKRIGRRWVWIPAFAGMAVK